MVCGGDSSHGTRFITQGNSCCCLESLPKGAFLLFPGRTSYNVSSRRSRAAAAVALTPL